MVAKRYSNGEVTVVWKPSLCMHSGICFRGLGKVFDPRRRPWVDLSLSTTEQIIAQVKECPSGALSISDGSSTEDATTDENVLPTTVEVTPNGPLLLSGSIVLKGPGSEERSLQKCALCRCGGSKTKPFCDGSHRVNGFAG